MGTPVTDPKSLAEALDLLRILGALPQLLAHGRIVSGVAQEINEAFLDLGVQHDAKFIMVGAALHDSGKIVHPQELVESGCQHEPAGEKLLLQHGISSRLARVCLTHGNWDSSEVTLDERVIALADHLWKGKRNESLERFVIHDVAHQLQLDDWDILLKLDPEFEAIASGGEARLAAAAH